MSKENKIFKYNNEKYFSAFNKRNPQNNLLKYYF